MSLCVRKPAVWVPTRSDTNQPVQSQKQAGSLKFLRKEGLYYACSENKGAVTAKLICAFVFAYADCWFSHAAAQIQFRFCYRSSDIVSVT